MKSFSKNRENARAMLVEHGFNTTAVQIAVMAIMLNAKEPLSQSQIKEIISTNSLLGSIKPDKTTVYRILDKFLRKGLIQAVFTNDKTYTYELASRHTTDQSHPHFKCLDCCRIYCLDDHQATFNIKLANGFIPKIKNIIIEGVCPNCSQ